MKWHDDRHGAVPKRRYFSMLVSGVVARATSRLRVRTAHKRRTMRRNIRNPQRLSPHFVGQCQLRAAPRALGLILYRRQNQCGHANVIDDPRVLK